MIIELDLILIYTYIFTILRNHLIEASFKI